MLLFLFACTGPVDDSANDPVVPLPEVWGVAAAQDHDPDPDVVEVHLTAERVEVDLGFDTPTEMWAYNGQVPGPLIQARQGDLVRVVLTNALPDDQATTIHWHGLRVSDQMDGIPHLVDPVPAGGTFTYEFVVEDTGSYWYHPHVRAHEQVERGLHGPLVVHEADAPDVTERFFVMDDVSLTDTGYLTSFNLSHMVQMHGRLGNRLMVNGDLAPLSGTVQPGVPERWRVVNTANARTLFVSVEGADWRVIGVDGGLLESPWIPTDSEVLPVGARLDLEVIPYADAETVVLNIDLPTGNGTRTSYPVFSALVQGAAGDGQPLDWPAVAVPAHQPSEQDITLELSGASGDTTIDWMINGQVFGEHEPIQATGGVPTWIRVTDTSGAEHPIHLHGNFFQVMERNGEPTDEPGLRDTVLVNGRDEVLLYTELENPGRWMSHCHILEHAELGMMTELVVSD